MLTTVIICLCFGASLHADAIDNDTDSTLTSTISSSNVSSSNLIPLSSSLIDMEESLEKIATTCLTQNDLVLLTGNSFRHQAVSYLLPALIETSEITIGLGELRSALQLPPLPSWKPFNWTTTKPSDHELTSASTIEEYYNLKEPKSRMRSLDSRYFFERNIHTAVSYLNKRVPWIQVIFKRTFEEARRSAPEVLDKKSIDSMIELYRATFKKVNKAARKMLFKDECWNLL